MLSEEQKKVLHYAIDNGFDSIEFKGLITEKWKPVEDEHYENIILGKLEIRIKQTPDSIDWTHVSTDIYCMARDEIGISYGYTSKIRRGQFNWATCDCSNVINMSIFASYKRGTVDWKESLVLNPYYKGKK